MDCKICMEDEIVLDLMVNLHCGHDLCTNCLDRLVLNQCPYCRTNIDNNKKQEDKTNYYLLIEFPLNNVDNTFQRKEKKKKRKKVKNFTSNRDRGEYERKSKKCAECFTPSSIAAADLSGIALSYQTVFPRCFNNKNSVFT